MDLINKMLFKIKIVILMSLVIIVLSSIIILDKKVISRRNSLQETRLVLGNQKKAGLINEAQLPQLFFPGKPSDTMEGDKNKGDNLGKEKEQPTEGNIEVIPVIPEDTGTEEVVNETEENEVNEENEPLENNQEENIEQQEEQVPVAFNIDETDPVVSVWKGQGNTAWGNSASWSGGNAPEAFMDAVIQPVEGEEMEIEFDTDVVVNTLRVGEGVTLKLNGRSLLVGKDFENNGVIELNGDEEINVNSEMFSGSGTVRYVGEQKTYKLNRKMHPLLPGHQYLIST